MNINEIKALAFLKYANGDFRVAVKNYNDNQEDEDQRRWSYYGFQQSIEKALKAVIICFAPDEFDTIHSLSSLMTILNEQNIPDIYFDEEKIDYAVDIDRDFTLVRYPDGKIIMKDNFEQDIIISKNNLLSCMDFTKDILSLANYYISNYIPKYRQLYNDFDGEDQINKLFNLKGWLDVTDKDNNMPSFQYINNENGDIYTLFINYEDHDLRKKEWEDNKRFRLLKNGKEISLTNSLDRIIHDFKADLKRNDSQGVGCGR